MFGLCITLAGFNSLFRDYQNLAELKGDTPIELGWDIV
jgi:hypothetical protein